MIRKEAKDMETQISSGLKTTFLVHLIVGAITGVVLLLIPEVYGNTVNWPIADPLPFRLIGAATLGFAASSWWAYRETKWDSVKIVVQMEVFWTALGTLVLLWGLIFAGAPVFGWVHAVILAGFAIAFGAFYSRH
jgi:hypothetical protein